MNEWYGSKLVQEGQRHGGKSVVQVTGGEIDFREGKKRKVADEGGE
jgi:hypothetical protein